jgi:hypothetical protein
VRTSSPRSEASPYSSLRYSATTFGVLIEQSTPPHIRDQKITSNTYSPFIKKLSHETRTEAKQHGGIEGKNEEDKSEKTKGVYSNTTKTNEDHS